MLMKNDRSALREPSIRVSALEKVYHPDRPELSVRAVDSISFDVVDGESVAIVGPSGCGKSTLLQILGCLDRPTGGVYQLEGHDVSRLSDDRLAKLRNQHLGFVFQSFNLLPRLSAVENVELPLLYAGVKRPRERAMTALERVGLADRATHRPNELSGGQKQRVAIARAIVTDPSVVLCDEPTGALDSRTSREVLDLLEALHDDGATIVMVTHDIGVARRMARAIWLDDGRVREDGASDEVMDRFLSRMAEG